MQRSQTHHPSESTVLFLDVVGSTRLYEEIGDRTAFAVVTGCLGRASEVVLSRGGRVVKYTGDGLMAVFASADAAADSTVGINMALRDSPSMAASPINVRMGFHTGPLIRSGSDIFGETVNIAARLASIASAGRALTTATSAARMLSNWREMLCPVPPRVLRGVSSQVELFELRCDSTGEATSVFGPQTIAREGIELRLHSKGTWTVLNGWNPVARIGREATSDICVEDQRASRNHAELELRGDKFVLIDQSSNGTYVTIDDKPEFVIAREDVVLHGKGWISLGRYREDNPFAIEYFCS